MILLDEIHICLLVPPDLGDDDVVLAVRAFEESCEAARQLVESKVLAVLGDATVAVTLAR